mmetsp:Transcript_29204/g.71234  ORF Transcript_29204/g.71234 Transcript_29204/m.71234 type:complete len:246 (+) Transcript_29204:966-1703(+)
MRKRFPFNPVHGPGDARLSSVPLVPGDELNLPRGVAEFEVVDRDRPVLFAFPKRETDLFWVGPTADPIFGLGEGLDRIVSPSSGQTLVDQGREVHAIPLFRLHDAAGAPGPQEFLSNRPQDALLAIRTVLEPYDILPALDGVVIHEELWMLAQGHNRARMKGLLHPLIVPAAGADIDVVEGRDHVGWFQPGVLFQGFLHEGAGFLELAHQVAVREWSSLEGNTVGARHVLLLGIDLDDPLGDEGL